MNNKIIAFILAGLACSALHAAEYDRELDQLTQERDKALAAALEPIQRRYKSSLESLLQRATDAKDAETALRIKQALIALSAKSPALPSAVKLEYLGPWKFWNHNDGHKAVVDINADGTFSGEGKRIGVWEVKGKQLIFLHDNRGGHSDRFELPVRAGKLEGKNTIGHVITIERKTE